MTKDEILKEFENIITNSPKDSASHVVEYLELARFVYKDNKIELIEIFQDWLLDNNNPAIQHAALRSIADLKIVELKNEVHTLKGEILKTRKQPFIRYDLEMVEKTISVLENGQDS